MPAFLCSCIDELSQTTPIGGCMSLCVYAFASESDTYRTRSSMLSAVGKASSSVPMTFCRLETELPLDDCLSADTRLGPLPPRRGSWRSLTMCSDSSSSNATVICVNMQSGGSFQADAESSYSRLKTIAASVGSRFKTVQKNWPVKRLLATIVFATDNQRNYTERRILPLHALFDGCYHDAERRRDSHPHM